MERETMQKRKSMQDYIFAGIFILGVVILRVLYISRTTGPFIYADEFGYWSHAAHMMGDTWAGVMDGMGWYSFGYSFWLALTFLVSNNMVVMYRAAILINVLMSVATYALVYCIVSRVLKKRDSIVCGAIAFVAVSFPTYIFYAYTTLAETLGVLVIWLLFYELILLEESPVWWKGALLGVTSVYAYMVHNRLLAAALVVCVCLCILWILRRIDWKIMISFVLSVVVVFLFYVFMKEYLEGMVADNQAIAETGIAVTRGGANTLPHIFRKVMKIFSLENIKRPLLSVMGQLWQCLSATYLLIGFGLACCAGNFRRMISEKKICYYCYPFLAFLFSVGLTGVVAQGPVPQAAQTAERVRIDPAFYGRYNECYFPLLIMLALIMLWEGKVRSTLRIYLGLTITYLCLSIGMYFRLKGIENGYLNMVSSISIHIFHWFGEFNVWKCTLTALLCGGILVGLCCWKRMERFAYYGGLLLTLFLFSTTALYCMRTSIRGENDYTMQYAPLYDYLNEHTQKEEIVYICDENKPAYDLQSRLVDKIVVGTVPEKIAEIEEPVYVVVRDSQLEELSGIAFEVCMECQGYTVLEINTGN